MAEGLDEERDDRSPAESHHDSIKDDLRAAFDQHTEEAEEKAPPAAESPPEPASQPVDRRSEWAKTAPRDERGRILPRAGREPEPPKGRQRQEAAAELEAPETEARKPVQAPRDPVEAMPAAFKPAMLEAWKALPREFKEEVHRRENEQAAFVAQAAPMRQLMGQLQQAVEPYRALLAAEGGSIPQVVRNYMQAATLMRNGAAPAKAEWIAQLASQFTRREDLVLLDKALAKAFNIPYPEQEGQPGQPPPQYQPQYQPQQDFRDPRVDQMLAQQQADQEQQLQLGLQDAVSERDEWQSSANPEYLPWVRDLMADLLDAAGRKNQDLSYQDAYDAAIRIHPEVRKYVAQKEEAARAQPTPIQRSRRAAVSLKPQGAVAPPAGGDANSIRSDISDAWESIVGR